MRCRLLPTLAIVFAFTVSGCGSSTPGGGGGHVHHFSTTWTYDDNYHWHECDGCDEISDKEAHILGELIVDTPASEFEDGVGHYECSVCDYVKTTSIPKTHVHNYSSTWSYDDDYHWHECSCGEKVDLHTHTFGALIVDVPATEDKEGLGHYECSTCGYIKNASIPIEHVHHFSNEWKYDTGWHWHECSCGETKDKDFHTFSKGWIVDKPATSTEDGSQHRTCDVCPYTETQVIPAGSTPSWATAIEISPATATVDAGGSVQLTAVLTPSDAQGRIDWSTDYSYAYVSENGLFTAYGSIQMTVTVPVIAKIYSPILEDYLQAQAYITINSGSVDPGTDPTIDDDPNPENDTVNFQKFYLNEDNRSYYLGGIKKETTSIIVPHYFKGLPVTRIDEIFNWIEIDDDEWVRPCEALESITIPTSIIEIHENAWDLNAHTHLIYEGTKADFVRINKGPILDGVTCSDGVFSDNMIGPEIEQYQTIIYNDFKIYFDGFVIRFYDYTGTESEISIPATYNGFPVQGFNISNAGSGLSTLETIHVNSFYGPGSNIDAPNLEKITIGYNVKSMGCPASNKPFNNDVIYEIDALSIIKDNNGLLMREDDPTKLLYCHASGSVVVPDGITTINYKAFYGSNVTSISLPDSVTTIESSAFALSHLSSITLPESVTEVGTDAFFGCEYLERATLSSGMSIINYSLFGECSALKSVDIPETITTIEEGAFMDCSSLESVIIPDSVKKISRVAFMDCKALKTIKFSNSLSQIEDSMCSGCESLESITLPKNLVEIGFSAFNDCISLTSIVLPESLLYIGQSAFAWCNELSSINIPSNLLAIGEFAFYDTKIPPSLIPPSVEEIGCGAFCGLDITSNSFGGDSRYIYEDGVVFNKNKTWLYHYNVSNTTECYEIPDTVKVIGCGAFSGKNTNLKSVIIPKGVKFIQENYLDTTSDYMRFGAFSGFYKLTVFYKGSIDDWKNISIAESDDVNNNDVATVCYYSNSAPTDFTNKYWHYVGGVPTIW